MKNTSNCSCLSRNVYVSVYVQTVGSGDGGGWRVQNNDEMGLNVGLRATVTKHA